MEYIKQKEERHVDCQSSHTTMLTPTARWISLCHLLFTDAFTGCFFCLFASRPREWRCIVTLHCTQSNNLCNQLKASFTVRTWSRSVHEDPRRREAEDTCHEQDQTVQVPLTKALALFIPAALTNDLLSPVLPMPEISQRKTNQSDDDNDSGKEEPQLTGLLQRRRLLANWPQARKVKKHVDARKQDFRNRGLKHIKQQNLHPPWTFQKTIDCFMKTGSQLIHLDKNTRRVRIVHDGNDVELSDDDELVVVNSSENIKYHAFESGRYIVITIRTVQSTVSHLCFAMKDKRYLCHRGADVCVSVQEGKHFVGINKIWYFC
jgi:hypothetical protein